MSPALRWVLAALALLVLVLPAASTAQDHGPAPTTLGGARLDPTGRMASYSVWVVEGNMVRARIILPKAAAYALPGPGKPPVRVSEAKDYVLAQFTVTSAGGPCPPIDQGEGFGEIYTMALSPADYVYEMRFHCAGAEGIVLHDSLLFVRVPSHVNYARVQANGARPSLQVFSKDHQAIAVSQSHRGAEPGIFARLGVLHLLRAADRLCVLLGLLLLAFRWKDLAAIAGGIAGGYAAAALAGVSGLLLMDRPLGEAAVAAMVAILGAAALHAHTAGSPGGRAGRIVLGFIAVALVAGATWFAARQSPAAGWMTGGLTVAGLALIWRSAPAVRPAWLLAAAATAFAFIDGMGPASDLARLDLPAGALAPALMGYGAAAAGLATLLVGGFMGLVWLAGRRFARFRNIPAELAGAGLVGVGAFWFVSRILS